MEKPISLEEWISKNCPSFYEVIMNAIKANDLYRLWKSLYTCEICNADLTPSEIVSYRENEFKRTCLLHRRNHKIKGEFLYNA
jgi:hypothetical protein